MALANYDLPLNTGWKFHLGDLPRKRNIPVGVTHQCCKAGGAVLEKDFFGEGVSWLDVALPHDWLTYLDLDPDEDAAGGFKNRGIAWYYVNFTLPETDIENARLVFEGVLGYSAVFVNGVAAARNFSGYNRFSCDVSAYLLPGQENTVALQVDATRCEGWWYEGAGLYRPARIQFRGTSYFREEDCFVRCEKQGDRFLVKADLAVVGDGVVTAELVDKDGNRIAAGQGENICLEVAGGHLWSPETPYLYKMLCKLEKDGETLDTFTANVGLRTVEWVADKGMFLNGGHYPVKGICCHQDHAGVGAAIPDALMEKRVATLKNFGINAYRCAHHAPAESLLEICDRLGMLVMVENRHFDLSEETLKQVDALVKLSRNHPCVFLYSLFNEEPWQTEERGRRIADGLTKRVRLLDSTRAITGAQNGGMLERSNAADALDVVGVNYFLKDYDATHRRLPQKVIIGTENCPTYATRGAYKSDKETQIFAQYGEQWGDFSESLDETMETIFSKEYVAGCFAWCGFDHRGEPTPYGWPSVISHWGFHDECGFAKDTAYLLGAWYREDLTVHLLPHWNWAEGEKVRVCAFTNADTAELFLNGVSLGVQTPVLKKTFWEVSFAPGKLTVVAKRGVEQAEDSVCTPGAPARLVLENWVQNVTNSDVRVINVSVTDAEGVILPDYSEEVAFSVSDGVILGIGNGDPNSHHHQKADKIRLFHGRAQLIVSAGAKVTAKCAKMEATI